MVDNDKDYGYKEDHHLIQEKVPPRSLIALREELAKSYNKDIYDAAIKGVNFEECLGIIAAKLDILLDGQYDAEKLCEVLYTALCNRFQFYSNPSLRAKGHLENVELVERKNTVTVEKVEEKEGLQIAHLPSSKPSTTH